MISLSLMFEEMVLRSEVGRGIGRSIGAKLGTLAGGVIGLGLASEDHFFRPAPFILGGLGNVIGRVIGGSVGKNVISNPEEKADFNKLSHRYGYLNSTPKDFFGRPSDYNDYKKRYEKIGYKNTGGLKMSPFLTSLPDPQNLKGTY